MPVYDRRCGECGNTRIDCFEPVETSDQPCSCGGVMERVWLTKPPAAVGDECDIWIRHGLCHEDGTPQHFTSKADIAREAKRRGLTNAVQHEGRKGGDRSKWTTRWY